jgi:hypothetical protein
MSMATLEDDGVAVEHISDSDGAEIVDAAARHNLGMSGEDFMAAWEAGKFDGDSDRPEIVRVAMLLPLLGG